MQCTYKQYDHMEELFKSMFFDAQDYVPSEQDLIQEIIPNIEEYLIFLLWIDLTGHTTKENEERRKKVHHLLLEHLEIVDESEIDASGENQEAGIGNFSTPVKKTAGAKGGKR